MATVPTGSDLNLGSDEFALYFLSKRGISASDLGLFLQRAASVSRRRGVEIRVLAIEPGSVVVKLKAFAKSVGKKAKSEFNKAPVATAAGGAALAALAVQAIAGAMHCDAPTPMSKAGSDLIIDNHVEVINVITPDAVIPLMNESEARLVREASNHVGSRPPRENVELRQLSSDLDAGELTGDFLWADGEPHFRPDGYRYLVPVKFIRDHDGLIDMAHVRYRLRGHLMTHDGQPDFIIIYEMAKL